MSHRVGRERASTLLNALSPLIDQLCHLVYPRRPLSPRLLRLSWNSLQVMRATLGRGACSRLNNARSLHQTYRCTFSRIYRHLVPITHHEYPRQGLRRTVSASEGRVGVGHTTWVDLVSCGERKLSRKAEVKALQSVVEQPILCFCQGITSNPLAYLANHGAPFFSDVFANWSQSVAGRDC